MLYISDKYATASTKTAQQQILAAGEAVMANNLWHSTARFLWGLCCKVRFSSIQL
jgi:hypothetical protein